jgi:hypothetical protein
VDLSETRLEPGSCSTNSIAIVTPPSTVNVKDFAAADPGNNRTLDKNEFLALVEKRFKVADPDNDGTIDAKELKGAAGNSLVRLLK